MSVTITEKEIKSKTKSGDRTIIIENIKYPYFESEKHKKLCRKMNAFYSDVAKKYSEHAKNRLIKKIKSNISQYRLPLILRMRYTAVLCGENIISVVLDLSFVQGNAAKERRFSQMWDVEKGDILPVSQVLKTDRNSRKKLVSIIKSKADENAQNPSFGYFSDYGVKFSRHFSIGNCFSAPNGLCFFIDAGILSPAKYGACNFIVSFSELESVIKEGVVSKNAEKTSESSDIVNNI